MTTTQLRRYRIQPGEMEAFVEWWAGIVPVRNHFGFKVLFAFVDESKNEFVWAVSHHGDFDEVDRAYKTSPERAAVFADTPRRTIEAFISKVKVVDFDQR